MNGTFVRRTLWIAYVSVLVLGVAVTATAQQGHVTLCHATGSASNPYVLISPSVAGAFHGHLQHTGPIFNPGPPDFHGNGGGWGDIIPSFQFQGQTYSLNWSAQGQAILAAGCQLPPEQEQPPAISPGPPVAPPEVRPEPPVEAQPPFTG